MVPIFVHPFAAIGVPKKIQDPVVSVGDETKLGCSDWLAKLTTAVIIGRNTIRPN